GPRRPAALRERAEAVAPSMYLGFYDPFLFVRALADYRQGRLDRAIATVRGKALWAHGPARLVLAMALFRSSRVEEARKVLADAVQSYDWRPGRVFNQHDWIWHVLRREAEALIVPELPAVRARDAPARANRRRPDSDGVGPSPHPPPPPGPPLHRHLRRRPVPGRGLPDRPPLQRGPRGRPGRLRLRRGRRGRGGTGT